MSDFKAKIHQIRFRWGRVKGRKGDGGEGRREWREGRRRDNSLLLPQAHTAVTTYASQSKALDCEALALKVVA